jgi:hypothetical protein
MLCSPLSRMCRSRRSVYTAIQTAAKKSPLISSESQQGSGAAGHHLAAHPGAPRSVAPGLFQCATAEKVGALDLIAVAHGMRWDGRTASKLNSPTAHVLSLPLRDSQRQPVRPHLAACSPAWMPQSTPQTGCRPATPSAPRQTRRPATRHGTGSRRPVSGWGGGMRC